MVLTIMQSVSGAILCSVVCFDEVSGGWTDDGVHTGDVCVCVCACVCVRGRVCVCMKESVCSESSIYVQNHCACV